MNSIPAFKSNPQVCPLLVAGRVLLRLLKPFAYPTYLSGAHFELEGGANVVLRQGPPPDYYTLSSLRCRVGTPLRQCSG